MTLLLLAGTGEARRIAIRLAEMGIPAMASLAGTTQKPKELALVTRHGGFGGDAGFERFLHDAGISVVLDATHPFAHRITERTARLCCENSIPYAQVLRPPWVAQPGDDWYFIDHEHEAAGLISTGSTVFLGTGPQGLAGFANLRGCQVICRHIDPPKNPFPFPGGRFEIGRPPFSVMEEKALFQKLGVDWLVVKNSGGAASRSKLDAARLLGIKVALINRPPQPAKTTKFETEAEALKWVQRQISVPSNTGQK